MPPKTSFNENECKYILELFNDINLVSKSKNVPVMFTKKFKRKITYKTLKIYFENILSKNKLTKSLPDPISNDSINPGPKLRSKTNINPWKIFNISSSLADFFMSNFTNETSVKLNKKESLFYNDKNLKEIIVNSNGLSFISSIRLYFKQFLKIEYSYQQIQDKILFHFIQNDHSIDLRTKLTDYFEKKEYDHNFQNKILSEATEIFNIDIIIFEVQNNKISKVQYKKSLNNLFNLKYIMLKAELFINLKNNNCFHYNLLIDKSTHFNYHIDSNTFEMKKRNEIDDYEFNSEIDEEDSSDYSSSSDEDDSYEPRSKRQKICKCGSTEHKNINHHNCRLNGLNKKQFHNIGRTDNFEQTCVNDESTLNYRHYCGEMTYTCKFCKAKLFKNEISKNTNKTNVTSGFCCAKGKIELPDIPPLPKYICDLLNGKDDKSLNFQTNIRAYNTCLAFTSLGVKLDERFANQHVGVYTFRIHGTIYHRIGSLLPPNSENPVFAQLYIYDTDYELQNRVKNFPNLNIEILQNLQNLMHEYNPYVKQFKQLSLSFKQSPELKMIIKSDSTVDRRIHNQPTGSEIGAILPGKIFNNI
jgi:hypothetical protein